MRIPGNFILSAVAVAAVAVVLAQPADAQMTLEELGKKAGHEGCVVAPTTVAVE